MSKKSFEIENFMTASLGLSGNELVLYAIMWKESEKGTKPVPMDYNGWSEAMGVKVPTVYNCINKLMERGVIDQECKSVYRLTTK